MAAAPVGARPVRSSDVKAKAGVQWVAAHWPRYRYRVYGALLVLAGAAVVVVEAIRSSSPRHPATGIEIAVLVALGGVLQIAGGATFGRGWRVEPTKARSAVRNLRSVGQQAAEMRAVLDAALVSNSAPEIRKAAVICEYGLAALTPSVENAMRDWNDVHPEMLQMVLDEAAPSGDPLGGQGLVAEDDVEDLPGVVDQ